MSAITRRAMARLFASLFVLAVGLGTGRAFAQEAPLLWASDAQANVPFVFHDPAEESRLTGFEYEIVQALGRRLGRKTQFVQNDWDGLIPGLRRGLYAMVVDGIEMTPEHKAAVLFSRPYYVTGERITVRRNETGLDSMKALSGHVVGTLKDTLAERLLREDPSVQLRSYEEESSAYTDLGNGRLDAILLDGPIALYYGSAHDTLKVVGEPVGQIEYGIAFAPGQDALREKVDAALGEMIADGELRRILARWNLWTPQMAHYTGDHTELSPPVAATDWQHYLDATAPQAGWWKWVIRYAGFLPLVAHGALLTFAVSACSMVLAVALGVSIALMRRYGPAPARIIGTFYVEIVRGTPLLIQVLFIFYALPSLGIQLSPFVAGVLALGLNYAAYEAENYRAGLQSVPKGQMEAAFALNMTRSQALRHVVIPQAFRVVVPVMTNDFISLLKDSSLVSVITLTELSQTYIRLSTTYFDYLVPGIMIGVAYLLLGLPFVRLARYAEQRLARSQAGETLRH